MNNKIKIVAEIGINFNNNIKIAKKLIDVASVARCDMVKFQKRDCLEEIIPKEKQTQMRKVPWHDKPITYLQYKKDMELTREEYIFLKEYASQRDIKMFSSAWHSESVKFLAEFDNIIKIPSAKITDINLLKEAKKYFNFRMMSTGMSTEKEIEKAVATLQPQVIFHTNSNYPSLPRELHMGYIFWLQNKYPEIQIGYSGHEYGIETTIATVPTGVKWIERHITLSHEMWGSDQKASVEPHGLIKLVKGIRETEESFSKGNEPRKVFSGEDKKLKELR